LLSLAGFNPVNYAFFKLEAGEDFNQLTHLTLESDTSLIFTSQYAVEWLQKAAPESLFNQLRHQPTVAVGQATAKCLASVGFNQVDTPTQQDSEGILALPQIQQCHQALLFKGEQGRDQISKTFKLANKVLKTYNIYKRNWLSLDASQLAHISSADQFVLTSGENALFLLNHADNVLLDKIKQSPCLVPSERVKQLLQRQGLTQVQNINSANNQAIIEALKRPNGN